MSAATAIESLQAVANNFEGLHLSRHEDRLFRRRLPGRARHLHVCLRSQGERPAGTRKLAFTTAMVGAMLISFINLMRILSTSLFGNDSGFRSAVDYSSVPTGSETAAILTVLVGFATLFGWMAILRGFFVVRDLADQRSNHTFKDAAFFLIAGTLLANTLAFTDVIAASIGSPNYLRIAMGL